MEGKREKEVIIVTVEEGETPRRHRRVNMADAVMAARREELRVTGVSLMWRR